MFIALAQIFALANVVILTFGLLILALFEDLKLVILEVLFNLIKLTGRQIGTYIHLYIHTSTTRTNLWIALPCRHFVTFIDSKFSSDTLSKFSAV